jgi:hypothetical protein
MITILKIILDKMMDRKIKGKKKRKETRGPLAHYVIYPLDLF